VGRRRFLISTETPYSFKPFAANEPTLNHGTYDIERKYKTMGKRMISLLLTQRSIGISIAAGLCWCLHPVHVMADEYPTQLSGAWGGRAAYAGGDNPAVAKESCDSYQKNPKDTTGYLLVFKGRKKSSYGGYIDFDDTNVSVQQLGPNRWKIIDRHFDDGEGGIRAGYKNVDYEATVNGDLLTIEGGNYPGKYGRCAVGPQTDSPFELKAGHPGNSVVSFTVPLTSDEGTLRATFDFGNTRSFFSPQLSQSSFSNEDHTLFAVNSQPMTKESMVHFFIRTKDGNLIFLNDVNGLVATLLTGAFSNSAKYFLLAESLEGRKVKLRTVDYSAPRGDPIHAPTYDFSIVVDDDGTISLAK
jgi:hypothetical protein